MKKQLGLLCLLGCTLVTTLVHAQTPLRSFEVMMKDKKIGWVRVYEQKAETGTVRELKTESDAKVLAFSVHVESDVKITKNQKVLIEGTAYRHASRGPEDVHAQTKRTSNQNYETTRNGKKKVLAEKEITFCVVDLYFEEPKGLTRVFSNMFADFVTIKHEGNGRYRITTPDKKSTFYTYKNGQLVTIEADTPVGTVVSRKV